MSKSTFIQIILFKMGLNDFFGLVQYGLVKCVQFSFILSILSSMDCYNLVWFGIYSPYVKFLICMVYTYLNYNHAMAITFGLDSAQPHRLNLLSTVLTFKLMDLIFYKDKIKNISMINCYDICEHISHQFEICLLMEIVLR